MAIFDGFLIGGVEIVFVVGLGGGGVFSDEEGPAVAGVDEEEV